MDDCALLENLGMFEQNGASSLSIWTGAHHVTVTVNWLMIKQKRNKLLKYIVEI